MMLYAHMYDAVRTQVWHLQGSVEQIYTSNEKHRNPYGFYAP